MKVSKLAVYANCDMTTIAWITESAIPGCRGFAIERDVAGSKGGRCTSLMTLNSLRL